MLRILSYLPFVVAFALGALIVDFWIDTAEMRQTAALHTAPEQTQQPAKQSGVPPAGPTQSAATPPVEKAAPEPEVQSESQAEATPPSDRTAVAVSIDDAAQTSAPAGPSSPEPVAQGQGPQPASDGSASEAPGIQAESEAARPTSPSDRTASAEPVATAIVPRKTASLKEMIGQMLIFGFQGSSPDQKWPQTVARQMADGTISGVAFLRYNLPSKAQARRLMKYFHARTAKAKHPVLFVLDQEGGRVQRLGSNVGVKQWDRPATIGRGSLKRARAEYAQMAAVVKDWGFNVTLGPVVDVNVNPANPIIGKLGRSFSDDPKKVVAFARAFIEAHQAQGILTALKHFPGHGSSKNDSHQGFTDISQTWQEETELAPYRDLIAGGYDEMVMTGHLYLDKYVNGGKKYPATLSKTIMTGLLRDKLGFHGVVISDDMEMGAIRKHYGTYEAAIRAIKAGVDLLIISNTAKPRPNLPEGYVAAIAKAAAADKTLRQRIEQSYRRIVDLKRRLPKDTGAI